MSQDIAAQLTALWQGVLLGAAMGLLYDFFRVLRARIKLPFLGPALDILFWCAVTAALFVWSQWIWGGVVRLYGAILCFGGGAVYFWLFSPWFLRLGWLCADLTAIFWRILTMPWKAGVLLLQKCKEFSQKSRVKAEKTKIFFQKASSGFGDVSFKERSGRFKA